VRKAFTSPRPPSIKNATALVGFPDTARKLFLDHPDVLYEALSSQLRSRPRLCLGGIGLSSPSEDFDMAENEKRRSWQLLLQEAVRDTDTSKLVELIHELKKAVRERERPTPPKPQLVRNHLEPELLELRQD
jgi:hypothetical protein